MFLFKYLNWFSICTHVLSSVWVWVLLYHGVCLFQGILLFRHPNTACTHHKHQRTVKVTYMSPFLRLFSELHSSQLSWHQWKTRGSSVNEWNLHVLYLSGYCNVPSSPTAFLLLALIAMISFTKCFTCHTRSFFEIHFYRCFLLKLIATLNENIVLSVFIRIYKNHTETSNILLFHSVVIHGRQADSKPTNSRSGLPDGW